MFLFMWSGICRLQKPVSLKYESFVLFLCSPGPVGSPELGFLFWLHSRLRETARKFFFLFTRSGTGRLREPFFAGYGICFAYAVGSESGFRLRAGNCFCLCGPGPVGSGNRFFCLNAEVVLCVCGP